MWLCRKCQQVTTGESRICRACGGILEEVPDGPPAAESRSTTEPAKGHVPSAAEARANLQAAAPWKCPNCAEIVPGTFDVCWRCLSDKTGQRPTDALHLLSEVEGDAEHAEDLDESADATESSETRAPERNEAHSNPQTVAKTDEEEPAGKCPCCGSTRNIPDVKVYASDGDLKVAVCGDPEALVFKDWMYGKVIADVCGACGHVELRVDNPRELHNHYQRSRLRNHVDDARTPPPVQCRSCRMLMSSKLAACPHCGASQIDS